LSKNLPVFEFHLAEHCNLNCAGCDHFSPIAEEKFADLDRVTKDMERLAWLTNSNVEEIRLIGGEPLLNRNVIDYFVVTRKYFPKSRILLFTNGILLSKQTDSFWQACKDNKVTITVSHYPINIHEEVIQRKCNEYSVDLYYQGLFKEDDMWRCKLDLNGNCNPKSNFKNCPHNTWRFLRNGRLYPCTFLPNIQHFNKYFKQNLPITESDSIDIYKAKSIKEILRFLARPVPFCKYCNIDGFTYGHKWGISKKDIGEWT
jgi:MoaA/NifB/PqqE/SkfB family radical SAM enzyme